MEELIQGETTNADVLKRYENVTWNNFVASVNPLIRMLNKYLHHPIKTMTSYPPLTGCHKNLVKDNTYTYTHTNTTLLVMNVYVLQLEINIQVKEISHLHIWCLFILEQLLPTITAGFTWTFTNPDTYRLFLSYKLTDYGVRKRIIVLVSMRSIYSSQFTSSVVVFSTMTVRFSKLQVLEAHSSLRYRGRLATGLQHKLHHRCGRWLESKNLLSILFHSMMLEWWGMTYVDFLQELQ